MTAFSRLLVAGMFALAALQTDGDSSPARPIPPNKKPQLISSRPLYGVFLFGTEKRSAVWAILDQSKSGSAFYDLLYLDVNADGDFTAPGERFTTGAPTLIGRELKTTFTIGNFVDPVSGARHTDFSVTWRTNRVSYKMKWKGEAITQGGYGTDPETYGNFANSPSEAPVLIPGHDLPFQFQHWMSGDLKRTGNTDFKVFMGNIGQGPGTFSCVDDKFLPQGDYVIATLIYKDKSGTECRTKYELRDRC
jgi:hypothetical protein